MPMSMESCAFWLDVIAAIAFALWLAGAIFVTWVARRLEDGITSTLALDGDPAVLTKRIAEALARGDRGFLQSIVLDDVTPATVAWHSSGVNRHRGSLRITGHGDRVQVGWEIHAGGSGLLTGARWVSGVGLLAIAVLYWALSTYVLPSESGLRLQVFQMFQAVHLLWPPFLFAGLALGLRRRLRSEVERVIKNQQFDLG